MTNRTPVRTLLAICLVMGLWTTAPSAQAAGYAIEVLVFENLYPDTSETFDPEAGVPDMMGTTEYSPAALGLAGVAQSLRQSANYRVLAHKAWVQPENRSTPTTVFGSEGGGTLEGTVQVERRRYLHVSVDLLFQDAQLESVRVTEDRRMRSEELHYLDHPKLGVLTIARPL